MLTPRSCRQVRESGAYVSYIDLISCIHTISYIGIISNRDVISYIDLISYGDVI